MDCDNKVYNFLYYRNYSFMIIPLILVKIVNVSIYLLHF